MGLRWHHDYSLRPEWDDRVRAMAEHIPERSIVLDLGAGSQALRELVDERMGVYVPCDLVARTPDTIVCDLNGELPQLSRYDVAFASGVLEYLYEPGRLFQHLAEAGVAMILGSYAVRDRNANTAERLASEWVSHYTLAALRSALEASGYRFEQLGWSGSHAVFRGVLWTS